MQSAQFIAHAETPESDEPRASARDFPQTAVKKKPKRLGLGF
ncbi:MAG: hypothetical protein Q8K42_06425 [Methylobacter sp.]|nr:hypothetical protein [Methylobacter sp.]